MERHIENSKVIYKSGGKAINLIFGAACLFFAIILILVLMTGKAKYGEGSDLIIIVVIAILIVLGGAFITYRRTFIMDKKAGVYRRLITYSFIRLDKKGSLKEFTNILIEKRQLGGTSRRTIWELYLYSKKTKKRLRILAFDSEKELRGEASYLSSFLKYKIIDLSPFMGDFLKLIEYKKFVEENL